jgi:hypothetical protein
MTKKRRKTYDLYTFVARPALEKGEPFPVRCNCGGVITVMPPFQDEYVVCPQCESTIGMHVIDGDPGFIIGLEPDGQPKLIPVQGSSSRHPNQLSQQERESILAEAREQMSRRPKSNG